MAEDRLWTRDFLLVTLANFAAFSALHILLPTLPLYVVELGGGESVVGIISGSLGLTAMTVRLWSGRLLDERGRKVVLAGSCAIFAAAGLLYPLASSVALLLGVRLLQGIGWGGSVPAAGTFAADIIPATRRGEGMGYFGLSNNLAMAVAPAAGLAIVLSAGFTPLFFTSVGAAVVAMILALFLHEDHVPDARKERGSLFEPSAAAPSLIIGLITFSFGGLLTFVSIYAVDRNLGNPAFFFVVYATALMLTRPLAGKLSDRRGRGVVLLPGIALTGAAFVTLGFAYMPWMLFAVAVLYGIGFGTVQPALQAMVVDRVLPNRRGAANAVFFTAFDLGIGLGAVLLGLLAGAAGISAMYFACAGLTAATLTVAFFMGLHRL